MALSNDLISQLVNVTKPESRDISETIAYGTVVEVDYDNDGNLASTYVRIDGATEITKTPVTTTTEVTENDRVVLMIKNHSAVIIGCVTSPSSSNVTTTEVRKIATTAEKKAKEATDAVTELSYVVAEKASLEELYAESARVENLKADKATVDELSAEVASIDELKADKANVNELSAKVASVEELKANQADVDELSADVASIEELKADKATVDELSAKQAEFESTTTEELTATNATIESLNTVYANIDFSNIGQAAMEYFYATSGLIEDVTVGNGTVTGRLVGVTISGDTIEGNTIVAEKLVIKGEDGLYYKLNTDGVTTAAEQTEYNSLNGSIITAKSITAEKVNVSDLVAFDATIGGFNITENAIFSEVKDSEGNTTRGIYMDTDGQINFGDETNFIKYYKDENGEYHLVVSAESILYALNGKQHSIADLGQLGEYVRIGTYSSGVETLIAGPYDTDTVLYYISGEDIGKTYKIIEPTIINMSAAVKDVTDITHYVNYELDINGEYEDVTFKMISVVLGEQGSDQLYNDVVFAYELNGVHEQVYAPFDYGLQLEDVEGTLALDEIEIRGKALYLCEGTVEPCIELGEADSDFKLVITNTRILFMEGTTVPAYINNQSLHITKAVIEEEIQQGEFVWKVRQNGNMGLMWKGDS